MIHKCHRCEKEATQYDFGLKDPIYCDEHFKIKCTSCEHVACKEVGPKKVPRCDYHVQYTCELCSAGGDTHIVDGVRVCDKCLKTLGVRYDIKKFQWVKI